MTIFFYADTETEAGARLLQKIKDQASATGIQAYRRFADLKQGLRAHWRSPDAAILLAANTVEMKRIASLTKFLRDVRIILVLPDRDKQTAAAGHRLQPRYISYIDSDFDDVAAVVRQMFKLGCRKLPPRKEKMDDDVKAKPDSAASG